MLVRGADLPNVVQTLSSLEAQTDDAWVLTVAIESSQDTTFTSLLGVSGLRRSTQKVRVMRTNESKTAAELFAQAGQNVARSDLALLFPGDVWASDAVAQLKAALRPGGMAYGDDDRLTATGRYEDPRLKPAFSPELLLRVSYIGRPLALSADLVDRLPAAGTENWDDFEHDLALRASELATTHEHVSEVLCHRTEDSPRVPETASRHIEAALARRGDNGTVTKGPFAFRITRSVPSGHLASIIIPFRDAPELLRTCIDSIDASRGRAGVEYVLVDNGSVEPETATLMERLDQRDDVLLITDPRPFNWAQLNNAAALQARGEVLVFLNNDIEARWDGWLEALCAQAIRPGVGAVGARLLYPDLRLQHCGVVIGLGGAAGHLLVGLANTSPGYLGMAVTTRECAAVTGACLATSRIVFDELDGFDETLGIDLNDIDYCLRAQVLGHRVLFEAEAQLIHHESPSRGTAGDVRDILHFIDRWEQSILQMDPYLNRALTRVDSSCALRGPGELEWWHQWRANLSLAI
jgi:GT2 family glycosyltransferase